MNINQQQLGVIECFFFSYHTKLAIQYMHLNTPQSACICKDTCSSIQAAIPPERLAAVAIASACTASAWHRDRSCSRNLSLRRSLQGMVSQTILLDDSIYLRHTYIAWTACYPGQERGRSPAETRRSTSGRTFRDGYSALAVESDRIKWKERHPNYSACNRRRRGRGGHVTILCTYTSPSPSPRLGYDPIRIHPGLVCLVSGTRD